MRQPVTNGPDAIRRALSLLVEPGSVVELRIPERGRRGIVSGYYDDLDALAKRADFLSGTVTSVCITLNPVNRALLARAANRTKEYAEATTADTHILSCRWWLIDIDPDRPSGISSTDEEHKLDLDKAQAIVAWLWGRGWTARMLLADSGNGAHVLVRVDLPNSDDARTLLTKCLQALSIQFTDARVLVDVTTANASHLTKMYGTRACKGDSTNERPHRDSAILDVDGEATAVATREQLEALAAMVPDAEPSHAGRQGYGRESSFRLDEFIERHRDRLHVVREGPWDGSGRKYILSPCPFYAEHVNDSAVLLQRSNGALGFKCHHNGCAGRTWKDLRVLVGDTGPSGQYAGASAEPENPWRHAVALDDFLSSPEPPVTWLEPNLLIARNQITEAFSPRGIGKTLVMHHTAIALARQGRRVLLVDRDNPRSVLKARLRAAVPVPAVAGGARAPDGGSPPGYPARVPLRRRQADRRLAQGLEAGLPGGGAPREVVSRFAAHLRPQPDPERRARSARHEGDRPQNALGVRPVQHHQRGGRAHRLGQAGRARAHLGGVAGGGADREGRRGWAPDARHAIGQSRGPVRAKSPATGPRKSLFSQVVVLMAGSTGLEPATSGLTVQCANQAAPRAPCGVLRT
jgi:hypothetical protein